jgi:PAS domain S-box-containing protein
MWSQPLPMLDAQIAMKENTPRHQPTDADLRGSESQLRILVESVHEYAIYLLDTEGRVKTWNVGAERIKGYEAHEIIGEHFSRFFSEEDVQRGKPQLILRTAAESGAFKEEAWRVRKDGSHFWAAVVVTALHGDDGTLIGFAKVTRDATDRKKFEDEILALNRSLEARVATRTAELEVANRRLTVLLQEVHHRVKNNLQVIASMLRLAQRQLNAPQLDGPIGELIRRVNAMALVHDVLFGNEGRATGDFGAYLKRLVEMVRRADPRMTAIDTAIQADHVELNVQQSIPLALIANEVISNALKHAFPRQRAGRIDIRLIRDGTRIQLLITDNGQGKTVENEQSSRLGTKIIDALARQLSGRAELKLEEGGARFAFEFDSAGASPDGGK